MANTIANKNMQTPLKELGCIPCIPHNLDNPLILYNPYKQNVNKIGPNTKKLILITFFATHSIA